MNDLGPTEEEACKNDEVAEEELMEDNVATTSDDTEDHTAEESKQQFEDSGNASEPKDVDATVVSNEGNNSKASKKVPFEYNLLTVHCG